MTAHRQLAAGVGLVGYLAALGAVMVLEGCGMQGAGVKTVACGAARLACAAVSSVCSGGGPPPLEPASAGGEQ